MLNADRAALNYSSGFLRANAEQKVRVLGHVVADDVLGDIYMVPLTDILSDIATELRAREVRLPKTREEMHSLLLRLSRTTHDAKSERFPSHLEGMISPLPWLRRTVPDFKPQGPFITWEEITSQLRSTEPLNDVERGQSSRTAPDIEVERPSSPMEGILTPLPSSQNPEAQRPSSLESDTEGIASRVRSTELLNNVEDKAAPLLRTQTFVPESCAVYQDGQGCESTYYWICCECGGRNSVAIDAGCANCNKHWRHHC